jgi:hypothetical protein
MSGRLPRTLALPVTAAVLVLSAAPALAQDATIPTTPIPEPANPGQPPISAEPQVQPLGHAVGDAGTALGVLRLLPNAVSTSAILDGVSEQLPKQALFEGGLGLSSAQANSEAYLSYERSIAQASPGGVAVGGNSPNAPGTVVQTALPDNAEPTTFGFNAPDNPLLNLGVFNGSAHARWSPTLGPCVGTISDASTSLASLSALDSVPTLPQLSIGQLIPEGLEVAEGFDPAAGLASLGGLLDGREATEDGVGSLLSLPDTMSSRSTVRLVDIPGSENKAVESTSTLQVADLTLFKKTPLEMQIKVVSPPTLRVTSTGEADTSTVEYTAPVLQVRRGEEVLTTLDAANPTADLPVGIPLSPLTDEFGPLEDVPVVGGLVSTIGGGVQRIEDTANRTLDLGVLKLSIAQLDQDARDMTEPFAGHQLGASARMLDLQILPTQRLKDLLPQDAADKLPSSLAQLSLGEQIARAYAPEGGVECGTTTPPPAPGGGGEQNEGVPEQLAQTSAAYDTIPLFWTGTGLLLAGVVLVAALPTRRRVSAVPVKPSPRPRN